MGYKMKGFSGFKESPLNKKESFKPHVMYDSQKAETNKEHLELKAKGYDHNSPTKFKGADSSNSSCWKGYKKVGTKKSPSGKGTTVNDCVKIGSPNKMRKTTKGAGRTFRTPEEGAGMTSKGVADYKRENPGSKLQTAVTGKVKPGSKSAGRRKSFCARSKGWTGERGKAARARWKC